MALIAMTTSDTVDFVSDRDPAKVKKNVPVDPTDPEKGTKVEVTIGDNATRFKLRPLDVFLMGHIYDNASRLSGQEGSPDVTIQTRVNQTNIEAVRHGLLGFDNFTDPKGGSVKFETQKTVVNGRPYDVASDAVMNKLGIQLIQEMAAEVKRISEVSAAEEKN